MRSSTWGASRSGGVAARKLMYNAKLIRLDFPYGGASDTPLTVKKDIRNKTGFMPFRAEGKCIINQANDYRDEFIWRTKRAFKLP